MKQCTSVLSSLTALLISPENAYLASLVLPSHELHARACDRAFGPHGRMTVIRDKVWGGGHGFRQFKVLPTDVEFELSRYIGEASGKNLKGSNQSAIWTPRVRQTLVNGVLQGRKQDDPRGASLICRRKLWEIMRKLNCCLDGYDLLKVVQKEQYLDLKESEVLRDRRMLKHVVYREALVGWTRNEADNAFGLDIVRT